MTEEDSLFHARFGRALPKGSSVATKEMIIDALKKVQDPELMLDVWSLGLIYNIDIHSNGDVSIQMTLTSPTCPIAGEMPGMVAIAVGAVKGVGVVDVALVWDPPWSVDFLSDELKLTLGIDK